MRTAIKHVGVALLFGLGGAYSATMFTDDGGWRMGMLPIPFALISAVLFLRTPLAVLVVPYISLVWLFAYLTAMISGMGAGSGSFWPVCAGGAVGGFGLLFGVAVSDDRLFTLRFVVRAVAIGALAALPFGFWLEAYRGSSGTPMESVEPGLLRWCFAIWQAAVGTYLYAIRTRERAPH